MIDIDIGARPLKKFGKTDSLYVELNSQLLGPADQSGYDEIVFWSELQVEDCTERDYENR